MTYPTTLDDHPRRPVTLDGVTGDVLIPFPSSRKSSAELDEHSDGG